MSVTDSSSPNPAGRLPGAEYDIFISYAHQGDNTSRGAVTGLVGRLHGELETEFRQHLGRNLGIFFDQEDIHNFDHWQVRCHRALRSSLFFIACLSHSYLRSDACRWEWEEWCRHELEHGLVGQGVAALWFVRLEDLDTPEDAVLLRRWQGELVQRFHIQCHEWRHDDAAVFLDAAARAELKKLTEHVAQRLRLLTMDRARHGNLPWPNANFVGREPELARLRAALLDSPLREPAGLHGVGGMGKTALALAFAHGEADSFPGGCWLLRCEGRESLVSVFRDLVHDLGIELTKDEKLDDAAAVRHVFEVLHQRGTALFVLDNVDRPALLAPAQMELLADQPWARLLYTTRLAPDEFKRAEAVVRPLDLDRLPEDQAVDLIRRYQPGKTFATEAHEAAARAIVSELSGLTLAVETASVYLGQGDPRVAEPKHAVDIAAYLSALREDLRHSGGEGVMSQLREVTATLRPTLARLDAPARTVLRISSLLGPDAIALPWLRAIAGLHHPELAAQAATGESDPWTQLILGLIGMRLFQPTPEARVVSIHRILQRVLEAELPEDRNLLESQIEEHVWSRDAELEKVTDWKAARWELGPLEALAWRWAESSTSAPDAPEGSAPPSYPGTAYLLNQAGHRRYLLAEWTIAEPLMRRALAINEASLGDAHPDVATALNNLASLLQATNRLAEAEPLMRRALSIDEASYGDAHPDIVTSLNNLALLLQDTNRPAEAEPLYRRALAIDEASYGMDHPNVATSINNLALLLQDTNRMPEAEPLMRRALAIDEASYGHVHPNIAIRLNNLAQLLQATNRMSEAEPLMRRALAIDKASYGEDHPNVARDLNNLARLLEDTNRMSEAEPMIRRALAIDEASYGEDHPNVAIRLNNLASLLNATNRLAEAEPVMRRALAILKRSLGAEHPNVATAFNNLASLLKATNRLTEAEPLYRRALAIDEASYGEDHPNVARDLNNLAGLLYATKRLAEAELLMRRHLEIFLNFTRATGHPHPHLQMALGNYTKLLGVMGRSGEEIERELTDLGRRYGMDISGAGVRVENQSSTKLLGVIGPIPRLFRKLVDFLQRKRK